MECARLLPLVFHRHVAQDFDERFSFVMGFFKRAPVREGRKRPCDFLSGHILKAARKRENRLVLKMSLTGPKLFV
jgi:hypothetical protein